MRLLFQALDSPLASSLLPNLHICRGPDSALDYDAAVAQAKAIVGTMFPGEEFMPRAPDPEEIIFEDGNTATKDGNTAAKDGNTATKDGNTAAKDGNTAGKEAQNPDNKSEAKETCGSEEEKKSEQMQTEDSIEKMEGQ